MKVIILCGGRGTRLNEETEFKPKPMVQVGPYPIIQHIMNGYSHFGHKDFVLCLGYKGGSIKDYFLTLSKNSDDIEFDMRTGFTRSLSNNSNYDYRISFVETGLDTLTTDRILLAFKYMEEDEEFMVTYGDGVCNIDINELISFHREQSKKYNTEATISVVHPHSKYGKIAFDKKRIATSFEEKKPVLDDYINGGFHVYNRGALKYFKKGEMLEDSLIRLTRAKKLAIYKHDGFWHCMDTMKDYKSLNETWELDRPWAVWEKGIKPDTEIKNKKSKTKKVSSKKVKLAKEKKNEL